MLSSKIISAAVLGVDAELIEVEADTGSGTHGLFTVVGLPDATVSESRERVRSAIKNSGFRFPKIKVTINLAPADLKKHGPSYDLPIALSILIAIEVINYKNINNEMLFVGELALNGELRSVNGVLPIVIKAVQKGIKKIFLPFNNANEASMIDNIDIIPVRNLTELVLYLKNKKEIQKATKTNFSFSNQKTIFDMQHVKGQENVKRALEISAAGAHNINMIGPPGSGKTLLAKTIPSILPDLVLEEALEITKIYSVSGLLKNKSGLITSRPFRSPHHTSSSVALVGGGTWPKPGEISLAHRGILFLDEFAEFSRQSLENLRQPLEDGVIDISRVSSNLRFPAKFILVAAMNPCPCGFYGDKEKNCVCSQQQILNYKKKISGPIMDRIDIHIEVPRINFDNLSSFKVEENSEKIKERIHKARKIQKIRFQKSNLITNSEMSSEDIKNFCPICQESKQILKKAVESFHLSARTYFRILKLARTIADLDDSFNILTKHIKEALQYRFNDYSEDL